mmetsp:Transcript_1508/g.2008  ORF Transcript_1508/g.2008 Transcript_1508/m.2008 type:complete len:150 (-) Transcript_1508:5280-5729(-)
MKSLDYIKKILGVFSIFLSSVPIGLTFVIDLLVIIHTNFAEWDINLIPASLQFWRPHSVLSLSRVSHVFMSRSALIRDDAMNVKVFNIGGHFFLNSIVHKNVLEKGRGEDRLDEAEDTLVDESMSADNSLEYLPNEIYFTNEFLNETSE